MSMQQLKELFGSEEAVLEVVQLEGGELALRSAGSEAEMLKRFWVIRHQPLHNI